MNPVFLLDNDICQPYTCESLSLIPVPSLLPPLFLACLACTCLPALCLGCSDILLGSLKALTLRNAWRNNLQALQTATLPAKPSKLCQVSANRWPNTSQRARDLEAYCFASLSQSLRAHLTYQKPFPQKLNYCEEKPKYHQHHEIALLLSESKSASSTAQEISFHSMRAPFLSSAFPPPPLQGVSQVLCLFLSASILLLMRMLSWFCLVWTINHAIFKVRSTTPVTWPTDVCLSCAWRGDTVETSRIF